MNPSLCGHLSCGVPPNHLASEESISRSRDRRKSALSESFMKISTSKEVLLFWIHRPDARAKPGAVHSTSRLGDDKKNFAIMEDRGAGVVVRATAECSRPISGGNSKKYLGTESESRRILRHEKTGLRRSRRDLALAAGDSRISRCIDGGGLECAGTGSIRNARARAGAGRPRPAHEEFDDRLRLNQSSRRSTTSSTRSSTGCVPSSRISGVSGAS